MCTYSTQPRWHKGTGDGQRLQAPLDGCAQLWLRADLSGGFLSLTDTCRPQMCNHVCYILGKREHHLNSEELQM